MSTGSLYLIPADLGSEQIDHIVPNGNLSTILELGVYVCENIKTGRRFLIKCGLPTPISEDKEFIQLSDDSDSSTIREVVDRLRSGHDAGYISEAGNPCIADPGEALVFAAHQQGIEIRPLVGPSSILLALIGSGMNAEQFRFSGYLDRDKGNRQKEIKALISRAGQGETQIFMETPYRNDPLLEDLIKLVPHELRLCVAADLTTDEQTIISKAVGEWDLGGISFHKRPAIFVLGK